MESGKWTIENGKHKSGIIHLPLSIFRSCASLHLIFLFIVFAFAINAQTISGTVSDARNAPVENAQVTLTAQTKIIEQTTTDAEGKFSINESDAQNSLLQVKAQGFASFSKILPKDFNEILNVVLSPAAVNEDVTVSITRTESRLSETPASVVVIDRRTLDATAAQTIDDALRQVAGFTLFRRSSSKTTNPTAQGANLRGVSGSGAARTSVELDGVSLNDSFGGWTYWTRVPRAAIEEVEVLRGGASTLYGDAALSGAVNLRTKTFDRKPISRVETSAGLQKTFDGSVFGAVGKNGWNLSASFDAFQTRGYIPTAEIERGFADSNADSRYRNSFLTLEKRLGKNARILGRGNYFTERRANGTRLTNNQTRFRQTVFGADFANNQAGAFQFRSWFETQIYDQTFSAISNNRNTETLSRIQRVPSQALEANLFWTKFFGNHMVSASGEFRQVRGTSDETGFANNRATSVGSSGGREQTFSFFAQDFWRAAKKLNLSLGARFDGWKNYDALSSIKTLAINETLIVNFPKRNESAFSPRVAALYQVNDNFSLYGAYSKSFRAPTLNELYRAFRVGNVLTQANENLRAERADTFETGVNFIGFSKKLSLRGNLFSTEVSNPVVSATLAATPSLIARQRQNLGKTRSRGLELDAEFAPLQQLKFSASYLFVDARVSDFPASLNLVGKFLPQIAKQQLTFQTFYRPQNKISFSVQARLSGAQFEDDLNTLRLRPFFTLDAFTSYKLRKNLEIFAAIENVFDNRYDIGLTPNRTVAAPRFIRVGLRFDLGKR